MSDQPQERGIKDFFGGIDDKIKDRFDKIEKDIERRITVRAYLQAVMGIFAALKEMDPENAALYADLQAELAARK